MSSPMSLLHEFAREFSHEFFMSLQMSLLTSLSVGGRLAIGCKSAEDWLWDRVGKGG